MDGGAYRCQSPVGLGMNPGGDNHSLWPGLFIYEMGVIHLLAGAALRITRDGPCYGPQPGLQCRALGNQQGRCAQLRMQTHTSRPRESECVAAGHMTGGRKCIRNQCSGLLATQESARQTWSWLPARREQHHTLLEGDRCSREKIKVGHFDRMAERPLGLSGDGEVPLKSE